MTAEQQRFFLFLGSSDRDAAVSKLKASGIPYRKKMLESGPENWDLIIAILQNPALKGVVGKMTGRVYDLITLPTYCGQAPRLLDALSAVPHVLFVHEAVLAGDAPEPEGSGEDDEDAYLDYEQYPSTFRTPSDEVRAAVNHLLEEHGVTVMPYKTNAELSVLAAAFLDDNEQNLLFRVYVPAGRLYAAEADRLLSLFRDWLGQVGRYSVRQDGYRTAAGQVYEFFGDGSLPRQELSREIDDFSGFLTLCVDDPEAATERLAEAGFDRMAGAAVVVRYGKEARRLQVDLRQARETRLPALRHKLESELLDVVDPPAPAQIQALLDGLVPHPGGLTPHQVLMPARSVQQPTSVTVHFSQQFINTVTGSVVQNVHGTAHLGAEAKELLELVGRFGADEASDLESAVHELEDTGARTVDRMRARQRIKGFLLKLGGQVEAVALAALQKYIEKKLELS